MTDENTRSASVGLLADLIEHPNRAKSDHNNTEENKKPHRHHFRAPSNKISEYFSKGFIRDNFPNFFEIGFEAQAFVDIQLARGAAVNDQVELDVKAALAKVPEVVFVYTVFGDVDLRCKVVGITLREIEQASMAIRQIPGVAASNTSIVLDDTDYDTARTRWAELLVKYEDQLNDEIS